MTASRPAIIELRNIRRHFGAVAAVEDAASVRASVTASDRAESGVLERSVMGSLRKVRQTRLV